MKFIILDDFNGAVEEQNSQLEMPFPVESLRKIKQK